METKEKIVNIVAEWNSLREREEEDILGINSDINGCWIKSETGIIHKTFIRKLATITTNFFFSCRNGLYVYF